VPVRARAAALLLGLIGVIGVGGVVLAAPASADGNPTIVGVLEQDKKPVPGVTITVSTADGFNASAQSGADGAWKVEVPKAGSYSVTLDEATLPQGVALSKPGDNKRTVLVFGGLPATVQFALGEQQGGGEGLLDRFLQLLTDGILFGLILSMAGVGLSLIYGTTGLTNFAHGELLTLGAVSAYVFNNVAGLDFILSAVLALLVCAVLGALQDRGLWKPLRRRGTGLIAMLVVSIGLSILLRYVILFFFGGYTEQFRSYSGQPGFAIGPIDMTPKALIGAGVAIILIGLTVLWLLKTRMGKASRAVADNPALASASGIDVERVINVVWIFGATLAAFGGILLALNRGVNWQMGFQILLLIFAGVTVGGLGTAFGALVGCLLVGVLIEVSTLIVPPELKSLGALAILIVVLLIRPQGILGRRERVG
jgi:branched-chain amino acid transport system permease protein